jgi:hypothetical protein
LREGPFRGFGLRTADGDVLEVPHPEFISNRAPTSLLEAPHSNAIDDPRLRSATRKDHRGFDLISDALPFGGLWYGEPDAISNAMLRTICGIGLLAVRPVALSCAFH